MHKNVDRVSLEKISRCSITFIEWAAITQEEEIIHCLAQKLGNPWCLAAGIIGKTAGYCYERKKCKYTEINI